MRESGDSCVYEMKQADVLMGRGGQSGSRDSCIYGIKQADILMGTGEQSERVENSSSEPHGLGVALECLWGQRQSYSHSVHQKNRRAQTHMAVTSRVPWCRPLLTALTRGARPTHSVMTDPGPGVLTNSL